MLFTLHGQAAQRLQPTHVEEAGEEEVEDLGVEGIEEVKEEETLIKIQDKEIVEEEAEVRVKDKGQGVQVIQDIKPRGMLTYLLLNPVSGTGLLGNLHIFAWNRQLVPGKTYLNLVIEVLTSSVKI